MKRVLKRSANLKQLQVRRLEAQEAPALKQGAGCVPECEAGPDQSSTQDVVPVGQAANLFNTGLADGGINWSTSLETTCEIEWPEGEVEFGLVPDAADFAAAGGGMAPNACVSLYIPAGTYC